MTAPTPLFVACLCAEWCRGCNGYRAVFERLVDAGVRTAWIDIEDHPDVLGALDVQTFPTLLIARGDDVLFFGPVEPHDATLKRLVRSALSGDLPIAQGEELHGLPQRARAAVGHDRAR